ncbi:hypothetical protein lerEdw1_000583 [Lerista edwardsae]|nr:hypothetical protein lerEdw1_000583 [Lerista edwardsae]
MNKRAMALNHDIDELTQSSDIPTEDIRLHNSLFGESVVLKDQLNLNSKDSVRLLHIQNKLYECRRLLEYEKGCYTQLLRKVKKLKNENKEQQIMLGEMREIKSTLDHQKVELKSYIRHLKFSLKQEKEKRMCAEMLYQKNNEQLKKKEEQYSKEMKEKQCLELMVQKLSHQLEVESLKCTQLELANRDLKDVANLKHHMHSHLVDQHKIEEYKRDTEERARQEINKTLEKVNLFLQAQAASQENLEQIRASHMTPLRDLEQRIRDLESELAKLRNSQQDIFQKESIHMELETYKRLYSKAQKMRKSLGKELDRVNDELAEANAKFLHEHQKNNWPQWMQLELEETTTRELNQAFAELDAGSVRFSPVGQQMDLHSN